MRSVRLPRLGGEIVNESRRTTARLEPVPRGLHATVKDQPTLLQSTHLSNPPPSVSFTSEMTLDAVTIVGLVLGVLGLFGISLMYNLSKRGWKILVCTYQNVGELY